VNHQGRAKDPVNSAGSLGTGKERSQGKALVEGSGSAAA
jgi:hypothetical protein